MFVSELLKEPHQYFRPVPKRLRYCYGAMQPLALRNDYKVRLHEGLPTATDLTRWFGNDGGIMVLDDLMFKGGMTNKCWICSLNIRIIGTSR